MPRSVLANERGNVSGQTAGAGAGILIGAIIGYLLAPATYGVSAVLSSILLGASIGGTVGGLAGALYDTQTVSDQVLQQNQLSRIFIQDSGYGVMIPMVFQKYRLAGNVIWLGNKFRHEHRDEQTASGKGGGPATITLTYTYTVSLAIMLTDTRLTGPIAGISKIWADGTVIYDLNTTTAGLPPEWTFYEGTATQGIDPTIESVEGAAQTPAYRFRCYIVGTDVDLGATGRVANYTFELFQEENQSQSVAMPLNIAVRPGDGHAFVVDTQTMVRELTPDLTPTGTLIDLGGASFLPEHRGAMAVSPSGKVVLGVSDAYTLWHLDGPRVTTMPITTSVLSNIVFLGERAFIATVDFASGNSGTLWTIEGTGAASPHPMFWSTWNRLAVALADNAVWNANEGAQALERFSATGELQHLVQRPNTTLWDLQVHPADGSLWLTDFRSSTLTRFTTGGAEVFTVPSATGGAMDIVITADGFVWVVGQTEVTRHDPSDGRIVLRRAITTQMRPSNPGSRLLAPSSDNAVWVLSPALNRLDRLTPSGTRAFVRLPAGPVTIVPDAQGNAWFVCPTGKTYGFVSPDMRLHNPRAIADLPNVLRVLSEAAGLPPAHLDVSLVPQVPVILGIVNIEAARVPIEMLCRAHNLLPVEASGVLKYLPRNQTVHAGTIPSTDLLATEESGRDGGQRTRIPELQMPTAVQVTYIDPAQSYQHNTQRATVVPFRAFAHTPQNERVLPMLIGMTAQQAKRIAQESLDRLYIERTAVAFAVSRRYAHLEAGDRVDVQIGGLTYPLLLTQLAYGRPGIVRCLGTVTRGGVLDQWVPMPGEAPDFDQLPTYIVPTTPRFLHLPALGPQDVASRYHVVYQAQASKWYGATLFRALDATDYRRIDTSTLQGVTGSVATPLAAASPFLLDDTRQFEVVLAHGTLRSISDLELFNGSNLALLGDELLAFGTALLIAPRTYRVGRLLRGLRGTESAVDQHGPVERFVLLDSSVHLLALPLAQRGILTTYKAVSVGQTLADTQEVTHTPIAKNLLPWSVAAPAALQDAGGDWSLTWWPRARFNSLWTSDNDEIVPDSDVESYQVRIWDGSIVVRAATVALAADVRTALDYPYTDAMQLADFGSVQPTLTWSVRQRGNYGWGEDTRQTASA